MARRIGFGRRAPDDPSTPKRAPSGPSPAGDALRAVGRGLWAVVSEIITFIGVTSGLLLLLKATLAIPLLGAAALLPTIPDLCPVPWRVEDAASPIPEGVDIALGLAVAAGAAWFLLGYGALLIVGDRVRRIWVGGLKLFTLAGPLALAAAVWPGLCPMADTVEQDGAVYVVGALLAAAIGVRWLVWRRLFAAA